MTLAQIMCFISFLVAFNVPKPTIDQIQAILIPPAPVVATTIPFQQVQTLGAVQTPTDASPTTTEAISTSFSVNFTLDKTQIINDGKDEITGTIQTSQPHTTVNICGVSSLDGSLITKGWSCSITSYVTDANGIMPITKECFDNFCPVSPFKIRVSLTSNPTEYFDSPDITVIYPK